MSEAEKETEEKESGSTSTSTSTSPRVLWRENLAVLALVPVGALAGALAHPDHEGPRDPIEAAILGGILVGAVALFAAPFVRLAHRFATEWLALLLGATPWLFSSLVADFARPHLGSFAARADYHDACVRDALMLGNLGASSSALLLAAIALALARLLESRHDPAQRPLARAPLVASLVPVSVAALAAAWTAQMWGFVVIAIVLSLLSAVRVAARMRLSDPRSISLGVASVLASALSLVAATSGATTHALAMAMNVLHHTRASSALEGALARLDATELASGAPIFALLPALGLAFVLEGRARADLPRRALVLTGGVLALVLWLDARNLVDLRAHVQTYAFTTGARELAVPTGELQLPTIDTENRPEHSFVVLSRHGGAWYRGQPLPRGLRDLRGLTRHGAAPALAMDASSTAREIQTAAAALGGREPTVFVGLDPSRTHVVALPVGRWVSVGRAGDDYVLLFLQITSGYCALASTAGERIEIPDCDPYVLRSRLEERRQADPNRRDILLAPEAQVTLQQIVQIAAILDDVGYTDRGVVDGSRL